MQDHSLRLLADISNPPQGKLSAEQLAKIVTAELEGHDVDTLFPQEMHLIETQVELAEAYSQLFEQLEVAFAHMGAEVAKRQTAVLFTILPKPKPEIKDPNRWGTPLTISTSYIGQMPTASLGVAESAPTYAVSPTSSPVTPQHWPLFERTITHPRPLTLSAAAERLTETACRLRLTLVDADHKPLDAIPLTVTTPSKSYPLISDAQGEAWLDSLSIELIPQLVIRIG